LQGVLPGDQHFLVTLPINVKSYATFVRTDSAELTIQPKTKLKSKLFIERLGHKLGIQIYGDLQITSEIPEGKGLSSSTADMLASARAIEKYLHKTFSAIDIESILRTIEPSDGIWHEHSVVYDHKRCSLIQSLGKIPSVEIISIDFGGELNTLEYNSSKKVFLSDDKNAYQAFLSQLIEAFSSKDLYGIGKVATESAKLNQKHNFKTHLDRIIQISEEKQAFGVINTHSGTCLGILVTPNSEISKEVLSTVKQEFGNENVAVYNSI